MLGRLLVLLIVITASQSTLARSKTDVIQLTNGDRVTGEISKLEHGKLRLKTDAMGTLQIEWDDIASIDSVYQFDIELTDGSRYFGTPSTLPGSIQLAIATEAGESTVAMAETVKIEPIEDSFWERQDGSLAVGYSFSKASDVSSFNLSAATTYRTRQRAISLSADSIITTDEGGTTERDQIDGEIVHFRANRRFNSWLVGIESNDELGLDRRFSFGGNYGRYLVQTNISELSIAAGILATTEDFAGAGATENLEALLSASYSRYVYDDPNVDVAIDLQVYPNLTDSGRVRAQFDARVRYELVNDLFLDLTLYDSYDSDPAEDAESGNVYGIVTSLGWSF